MALISRITSWISGQVLKSADLNGEFNNVVNTLNNLDSVTTSWTGVKTGTLTSTGTTVLAGTTTNDSAAAGNIGEIISSPVTAVNLPSTGVYGDITSIILTAGDWDVSGVYVFHLNGATVTQLVMGLSINTGTSFADSVSGDNQIVFTGSVPATSFSIPNWRKSVSSSTTIYAKMNASYSVATPNMDCRISARRVR